MPFHLTTQEFYRLVKSRLTEGGVVAQNVEPTTMFFDSAYATMKSVFDQVDAIDAGGNIVLIGIRRGRGCRRRELARRAGVAQEQAADEVRPARAGQGAQGRHRSPPTRKC